MTLGHRRHPMPGYEEGWVEGYGQGRDDEAHGLPLRTTVAVTDRCPSCEHRAEFHQPEGCWYSVTDAKPGTTVACNCIGWTA